MPAKDTKYLKSIRRIWHIMRCPSAWGIGKGFFAQGIRAHCTFHGFRSYATTQMANAEAPEIYRKRKVGHKDNSTHAGYTRSDMARLKVAVDKII